MEPGIVQEETALESLPEAESAARLRRHDDSRVRVADQRSGRIAPAEMPLAEEGRVVAAGLEFAGDRRGINRKGIEIVADAVFRGREAREERRPGERSEGMGRDRLDEAEALRGESVEGRRARIRDRRRNRRPAPAIAW